MKKYTFARSELGRLDINRQGHNWCRRWPETTLYAAGAEWPSVVTITEEEAAKNLSVALMELRESVERVQALRKVLRHFAQEEEDAAHSLPE
jgi:hypothetical protein